MINESTSQMYFFTSHKCGTSFLHKALVHFTKLNNLHYYTSPKARELIDKDNNNYNIHKFDNATGEVYLYRNSEYSYLLEQGIAKGIRIIRNPLSIVKSAYYSHLNTHKTEGWPQLEEQKNHLHSLNFNLGIEQTINFLEKDNFFQNTAGPLNAIKTWPIDDENFLTVRMEDITLDPTEFFKNALHYFGLKEDYFKFVPPHMLSFEYQSGGRKLGQIDENSHLRSGDHNEWKTILPPNAQKYLISEYKDVIQKYYPEVLI